MCRLHIRRAHISASCSASITLMPTEVTAPLGGIAAGCNDHAHQRMHAAATGVRPATCCADVPEDAPPFKYKGLGSLAYIGHGAAVIDPAKSGSVLGYIRCACSFSYVMMCM